MSGQCDYRVKWNLTRPLKVLGPGLVTGAADDDPSGIATYSQAGAQFGFQLGWTLLLTYPLMVAIQAISARIGRTTGKGIAGVLREHYPKWLLYVIVALLFTANTLNIGADLGAMAQSSRLLLPQLPGWVYVVIFAFICTLGQILLQHKRYVSLLKWLTLSLFAYFATVCVVHVPWLEFAKGMLWPRLSLNREFWLTVVAILGTTISPYLFFWQAAQEVEDTKAEPCDRPLREDPAEGPNALARIKLDTLVGMGFSNLVALAILVTAAATLHQAGVTDIDSAARAAQALQPLAGNFAAIVFSIGIIGTGLLSIPVLAGSAAYALGEARRWPVGLARKPLHAKAFYGAITVATLLGAVANVFALNPVKALVWAAVLNGIVAVPVMVLLMLLTSSAAVMGQFKISGRLRALGWAGTGVMAVASGAFILATVWGGK
ncbi:MAG: divalent metal cation transporter [Proteobacteria bacterium]|nr:divalent metal cation transporter [Pseudomonadota bacterium]